MTEFSKETSDFDFLTGYFDVVHRRLKAPLTGSDDWYEFAGTSTARTHLDGAISIDEMQFPDQGFSGMSIRLYDPAEKQWTIYWVNSRDCRLQPPVRGRWADGSCRLVGEDEHEGRPILASYRWSDITEQTAHWEQAFSVDGGKTWELNWTMDFTRRTTEPPPPLDLPKLTGDFDFFVGPWNGVQRRLKAPLTGSDEWYELTSTSVGYTYFNGAISVDEVDLPALGIRGFTVRLYDPAAKTWSIHWVNSRRGVLETPVRGGFGDDGVGLFYGPDEHDGRPIDVRFRWTRGEAPTWEQSFSPVTAPPSTRTWEPNWQATFTRPA
ncbi:MAG TPA: hypothetical protein VFT31_00075 [Kribbella sp.]|nr:hypothetical protein [Kribbella sp.]